MLALQDSLRRPPDRRRVPINSSFWLRLVDLMVRNQFVPLRREGTAPLAMAIRPN